MVAICCSIWRRQSEGVRYRPAPRNMVSAPGWRCCSGCSCSRPGTICLIWERLTRPADAARPDELGRTGHYHARQHCGGGVSTMTDTDAEALLIPRMYSDEAGACRFDQVRQPLTVKEYAPPAASVTVG